MMKLQDITGHTELPSFVSKTLDQSFSEFLIREQSMQNVVHIRVVDYATKVRVYLHSLILR